jgi:hypothetical protein
LPNETQNLTFQSSHVGQLEELGMSPNAMKDDTLLCSDRQRRLVSFSSMSSRFNGRTVGVVIATIILMVLSIVISPCDGLHTATVASLERKLTESQLSLPTTDEYQRDLAVGDFDRFNTLFKDAVLKLTDQEISAGNFDLKVTNLQCTNIQIGDVTLDYSVIENDTLALTISAAPFSMDCTADYDIPLLSTSGSFQSFTVDNSVDATMRLIAPNSFAVEVPSQSEIVVCASNINVENTDFTNGGLIGFILTVLEDAVSELIGNQAKAGSFHFQTIYLVTVLSRFKFM